MVICGPYGQELHLTAKEFAFITCLAKAPNGTVSRKCLMEILEYERNENGHRLLEALICRLRKEMSQILDTPSKRKNGSGYALTLELEMVG